MSKSFYDFVVLNMKKSKVNQLFLFFLLSGLLFGQKIRPRDLGLQIGLFKTGRWNAITDVMLKSANLPTKQEIEEIYEELHNLKNRISKLESSKKKA